ncbi:AP-3 complex subunit beta-2-like [Anopheles albimanus]|uniref:AP-3 complex subunit beta n=1 Tax=Anopheles albimanus TaxID=7167 RepID=A0A182F7F6_ANOAL|nr:AP-3 complex subunit beta-2-like [Anopheles albimanus]
MLSSGSAAIGVSALASTAYGNERTEVAEYANEGGFFHADYKKHDDLKQMLDSNKDSLKLEAMKRIIGMIAKGRDASDLFPAVVKNVVSKNIEVKKLVYVYLVRYAEEQQDLALLSISTFQRALKDPNQLIRASALRVLSSIRVSMIVPIVMLAIRDSASDMSPYVRKTAAHAIPKLYHLDPEQKEELMVVIEKLLADRTTLVVGSAVMAFEEVCPERTELIHKNYRKLCNLLADVDEWGQVLIINMLTRYARTQFLDPNAEDDYDYDEEENKPFYEDDSNSDGSGGDKGRKGSSNVSPRKTYTLDIDHRMLLRQTKPLLQSRNASVVMAVAQLYHHVAPRTEVEIVAKALIRLLRSYKEVQSVVLTCIASMSIERKSIFEPFLKSFFVRTSDQTHIKLLKLEIMTNLATATSISVILREFQTYISSNDKDFVASTIQAIGRCAVSISEVTETCLSGLVHLLSNKDEYVVAESVVVIKKLLQTQKEEHFEIISQMAKLLDFIQVPAARASILWLIGEYNEKVPKIAPDVLRKLVKTFIDEQDIVKLQVLNLAVKLHLTNPTQTALLCQHLHNLARYDPNYDIRDRARFLKPFLLANGTGPSVLQEAGRRIFLAEKPAPTLESKYHGRRQYQLGSLSHYLNMPTTGYQDLPAWPTVAPDSSVRHVEQPTAVGSGAGSDYPGGGRGSDSRAGSGNSASGGGTDRRKKKTKSFYSGSEDKSSTTTEGASSAGSSSDSESSSGSGSSSGSSSSGSGSSSGSSESGSEENSGGESSAASEDEEQQGTDGASSKRSNVKSKHRNEEDRFSKTAYNEVEGISQSKEESSTEDSEEDSSSDSYDSSTSGSASSASSTGKKKPSKVSAVSCASKQQSETKKGREVKPKPSSAEPTAAAPPAKSNLDLLLDLDDIPPIGPVMTPSLGGFLTPMAAPGGGFVGMDTSVELVGPSFIPSKKRELLNKVNGFGLGIEYRFVRAPHLYSSRMVSVELAFTNYGNVELEDIEVGKKANLPAGVAVNDFAPISRLNPGQSVVGMLGVDFNDSTQPIAFEIRSGSGTSQVTLKAPVGEMVRSIAISEATFDAERSKLRGMTEHSCSLELNESLSPTDKSLQKAVFEASNVASVALSGTEDGRYLFAGQTMSSKSLVLIVLERKNGTAGAADYLLTVNCEKLVVGSMLMNELKAVLKK